MSEYEFTADEIERMVALVEVGYPWWLWWPECALATIHAYDTAEKVWSYGMARAVRIYRERHHAE